MRDPYYAINAFYDALAKVEDYQSMRITEAAQRVQRSGFPEAYEDHADDARALASALTGYSPGGLFSCVVHEHDRRGQRRPRRSVRWSGRSATSDIARTGSRQDVALTPGRQRGGPAPRLVGVAVRASPTGCACTRSASPTPASSWRIGRESEDGWHRRRPTAIRPDCIAE